MNPNPKRTAAVELLVTKGIWPVNYVPRGLRLLWYLGVDARPPLFANFWSTVVWQGSIPSLIFALMIWAIPFLHQDKNIEGYAVRIGIFYLVVGGVTALSNMRLKRKHNLPSWEDLDVGTK